MGVIKQGILGGFSGSVANIVGSSWKGIAYMKAKPLSVANPRTTAQVAQRTKFSNAVDFAKAILSGVIKPLNDRFAVKMSGFNLFIQRNIELFDAAMPSPAANLVIASGKMAKTDIDSLNAVDGSHTVEVFWTDDSGSGFKLASDLSFVVGVNESTGEIAIQSSNEDRSRASNSIDFVDPMSSGDVINVYSVFLRADGTIVSNTAFKTVTVA